MTQYVAVDHAVQIDYRCPQCGLVNDATIERARVGQDGKVRMMCMGCKGTGMLTLPQWTG